MGSPASENSPMAMAAAKNGCIPPNPAKSLIISLPVILKKEISPPKTTKLVTE